MPIAIVLRKDLKINLFRDSLISALACGVVDKAYVASGFFQEGRGSYQASLEPGLVSALMKNSVEFNVLGVYSGYWYSEFLDFVYALDKAGVKVFGWKKSSFHWHAKIAILMSKGKPVFAIVGSSNMTSRAFGVGSGGVNPSLPVPPSLFNFECDTIIWDDGVPALNSAVEDATGNQRVIGSVIRAPYIPGLNGGITLQQRLEDLLIEIEGSGFTPI